MGKQTKQGRIAMGICVALVLILSAVWYGFGRPETSAGEKEITVEIIVAGEETQIEMLQTDAEFLSEALLEVDMIAGEESAYGLFVTSVLGREADASKEEWWCMTKGQAEVMTGFDSTPIADGDVFELTLMQGY